MLHRFAARALLALTLAAIAAPSLAQQPPPDQRAAIDFALARGRPLYEIDRAAWVATDDMTARMPNWRDAGMRGYVVDRDGNGYAAIFFGGPESAPVAFYRGRVVNNRIVGRDVYPAEARPALTPMQRRLVAARAAAGAGTSRRPCNDSPFNVAVIPPSAPEAPIDVYLMTAQVEQGRYPLGGHHRLTIAPDGRVLSERAFANSCIVLGGPTPGPAVAMVISHVLDPVPTEIHVFTALASRLPLFVAIQNPERVYEVRGDRIRAVPVPRRAGRRK